VSVVFLSGCLDFFVLLAVVSCGLVQLAITGQVIGWEDRLQNDMRLNYYRRHRRHVYFSTGQ